MDSTRTLTLTDFLLARIAEDEAAARAASAIFKWSDEARDHVAQPAEPAAWITGGGYGSGAVERTNGDPHEVGIVVYDEGSPSEVEAAHIARHDPARVLAECESKRRIVERCCLYILGTNRMVDPGGGEPFEEADPILRDLAAVYADHDDYREEWKP